MAGALQQMVKDTRSGLAELNAEQVISIVLSGTIAGVVTLITSVSFAALMFNGVLAPFVSSGITILVATAVVAGSLFSLFSGARPVVAMPDDDTAPVLALMVTLVVASFPQDTPAEVLFVTAFAALACAALLTGVVLAALGTFKLGSLVRYLPYSVMGGYFAGAGLLLIQGALRVVTDMPLESAAEIVQLFAPDTLLRWVPAVLAALVIRLAIARLHQSIAMPVGIFLLLGLFFGGAALFGLMPSALMGGAWLVGPFPEADPSLVNPVLFERFAEIQWSLVFANLSSIGTIIMLSAISLMLTASGLSLAQRDNIDINRELRVAGVANGISGLTGGLVALPSMGLTELAMTVGAPKSRLVGLVVAGFCALMLFFGMGLIAWFPKAVLAGLLIFLGASLLERWLIEARSQLPGLEYAVVVIIVTVVATVGFLEGVLVGLLCAIALFVINYSRINVVRYAMNGSQRKSNVERNTTHEQYLKERGAQTQILKLQGYLFFGTAAALVSRIEERLEDEEQPPLRYCALDFAQVTGMDSSAALSFMKLAQEAAKSDFFLLLTGLSQDMQERLMGDWLANETSSYVQLLPDLDRGVEWCEERMLKEQGHAEEYEGVLDALSHYLPAAGDRDTLLNYLERKEVSGGEVLAKQGEPSDSMFLLETCTASVYLDTESGKLHRIRRAGSGTVFGEVGFYLGGARTASVIIDEGGELYVLHQEANQRLEAEHPHIAAALHKFMISVITRRLQLTTTTLQAVLT
jgi:sulfate permease, SulP family